MNLKKFLILVLLLAIALFFFLIGNKDESFKAGYVPQPEASAVKHVKIGGINLKVDLAITLEEQGQGLSGREKLDPDTGMLFVFDRPDIYSFWMKDMKFAIDMIWLSTDLKIVHIEKNAKPDSYPKSFAPTVEAKYVLEVPAGFSDKNKLKVGDPVQFVYE